MIPLHKVAASTLITFWEVYVTDRSTVRMLPAKLKYPPTVEAGMNPGFVRTGLRGYCGKVAHTPAAHGGRTRDIQGSI